MVPSLSDPSDVELLSDKLRELYLRGHRVLNRAMTLNGASFARTRFLRFIASAETARSSDLAEVFGMAPRTITEAIDGLERDGLVRREPDAQDRRVKRISITAAGHAAIENSEPVRRAYLRDVFGSLTPEETRAFAALVDKVNGRLTIMDEEQAAAPISGT